MSQRRELQAVHDARLVIRPVRYEVDGTANAIYIYSVGRVPRAT